MILEEFENITNYPITTLYKDFTSFIENGMGKIEDYYTGVVDMPDASAFKELERLTQEYIIVNSIMISHKRQLTISAEIWEVLDQVSDMLTKLESINVMGKWLRSCKTNIGYNANPEISIVQSQNQTIEKISNIAGDTNSDNNWSDIAIRNDIKEEDYTMDGGKGMIISTKAENSIVIDDVIDYMTGVNIYGKDIQKRIEFDTEDEGDIKTLSPEDTIVQCYDILINHKRGISPEDPFFGYRNIVGGNRRNISYPIFFRQVQDTLLSDDLTQEVNMISLEQDEDNVIMSIAIKPKLSEELIKELFV